MSIADLISQRLASGLYHPGGGDQPPMTIRLPLFRTAGMPSQMANEVETTTKLLGEAIVYLIENDGHSEIIDRDELAQLREPKETGEQSTSSD